MSISTMARSLATDGRLSSWDARKVLAKAAQEPGAAEEVKKILSDPGLSGVMTPAARRRLTDFVSAAASSTGALGSFPDGTKLFLKQGVFLDRPDAALPNTPQAYGDGLYRASRLFAEPGANVVGNLSAADKQAVVDRVMVGLRQCAADGNQAGYGGPTQAAQQRSASATVLREIMASCKGSDPQALLLQDKCLQALSDMVAKETVPGLRDHMAFHVNALKDTLATPEQKAVVDKAYEKFAPVAPPYAKWFAGGNNTLNVVCHTGSEFYDSEVKSWEAEGFKVVEKGDWSKPSVLEKDMAGPGGQVTKVRMRMYNGDSGMFDDMGKQDVHVVAYSGHSGWGKNVPRALRNSPQADGSPKVLLIHQCCGQGITNKIRDKYPETDLVTTRYSSYEHEDHFAFKTFLEGVAGRKSWDNIHDNIANGSWNNRRNNYTTPSDELTRMKTYDRDGDGKADLLDRVYDFNAFDVPGDTQTAFEAKEPSNRDAVLAGGRVHNASQIVNTTLGFSDYLEHLERPNPFISGGYFDAAAGSPEADKMVRIVEKKVDLSSMGSTKRANLPSGPSTMYEVQLNRRFAHASEEVVKAATFMEVAMLHGNGSTKADKALEGLMLVAHSTDIDVEYGREREIFAGLRDAYGLPDSLTYEDARRNLGADSHIYAGSMKGLEQWKKSLGAAEMQKIEQALGGGGHV